MGLRVALIDLNGIPVFDRGFAIFASFEVLIAAVEVLVFPNIRIMRTAQYRRG